MAEEEEFDVRGEAEQASDGDVDRVLRPAQFEDFTGQRAAMDNLQVFVQAARQRQEALDHVLLHGPPGLGKTTLANIVANEMGVAIRTTSGPVLDKPGDLAGLLTSLDPNDVLFIGGCHYAVGIAYGTLAGPVWDQFEAALLRLQDPHGHCGAVGWNPGHRDGSCGSF